MNHLEWKETNGNAPGPVTTYGYWEGAKCFSIFYDMNATKHPSVPYILKAMLPGFRPDLPYQKDVETAQAFAEKMLTRWVAKRGLLFKAHIVVTDAMKEAGLCAAHEGANLNAYDVEDIIRAALAARG